MMQYIPTPDPGNCDFAGMSLLVQNTVDTISAGIQEKYGRIQPGTIPDHVNYSKVEKYLRSVNVEVTRRMFDTYLKEELLPNDHEVKNRHFSFYTHEQITYFILVDLFKPILPLGKVKVLLKVMMRPMIDTIGLDATYIRICENIVSMANCFEKGVISVVEENMKANRPYHDGPLTNQNTVDQTADSVAYYTHVAALCMVRGALDFYQQTPDNLMP